MPGRRAPRHFPLWGIIMDDFWVMHSDGRDELNVEARGWAGRLEDEWGRVGVQSHPKKAITDARD
eukprot:3591963-Lingulodinium_polyedra.AAC.1